MGSMAYALGALMDELILAIAFHQLVIEPFILLTSSLRAERSDERIAPSAEIEEAPCLMRASLVVLSRKQVRTACLGVVMLNKKIPEREPL